VSDKSFPHSHLTIIFQAVQCERLIQSWNNEYETNGYVVCRDSEECDGVTASGTVSMSLLTIGIAVFAQAKFRQNTKRSFITNSVELSKEHEDLCFWLSVWLAYYREGIWQSVTEEYVSNCCTWNCFTFHTASLKMVWAHTVSYHKA